MRNEPALDLSIDKLCGYIEILLTEHETGKTKRKRRELFAYGWTGSWAWRRTLGGGLAEATGGPRGDVDWCRRLSHAMSACRRGVYFVEALFLRWRYVVA